jgi:two-component system, LytTR family, sensor kinase
MRAPRLRGIARAYLLSLASWGCFALLMVLQFRPFNRQNPGAWFVNLMVEVALRALAFSFWTPPIFYLAGKYLNYSRSRFRAVLFWSLGAAPFVVVHTSIIWLLIRPYDPDAQKYVPRSFELWRDMIRGGFADQIFLYAAIVVAAHAYAYLKRVRTQEREKYEYQQALATSELQALKMQLHPHFLFNTLHGIATLVDSDPKTSKDMILKLSSLLRTALDRGSADLIPLEDELKFVREYLDLEKMRFGSRLKIQWLIAAETRRLLVPQMILQPLVENAIRHGVTSIRVGGWIEIAASVDSGIFTIKLRNNVGDKSSNGTGVGLRNAEARLKYLYSGDASVHLAVDEDRIATVCLTLPALNSQSASFDERRVTNSLEKETGYASSHRG